MTEFARARERRALREWYRSFAMSIEHVMQVYAHDVERRRKINDDNITVPWKRCDTHAFIYLYGVRCPLCYADAHGTA